MDAVNFDSKAWRNVLAPGSHFYGLMLPILLHCKTSAGQPMLGPPRASPQTQAFLKQAYVDIPTCVQAIRQHYRFTRYA